MTSQRSTCLSKSCHDSKVPRSWTIDLPDGSAGRLVRGCRTLSQGFSGFGIAFLASTALSTGVAQAQSFTITNGQTVGQQVMNNDGDVGTIESGGRVTNAGEAVRMLNSNQSLSNSGQIDTTGASSHGVSSTGANVVITNDGTVSTTGNNAHGSLATGTNASVTNNNQITTTGGGASGMRLQGGSGTLTNNGTITSSSANGHGMTLNASSGSLINTGTIDVNASGGYGMLTTRSGNTISNTGSIITRQNDSHAISLDDTGTATNSGTVQTLGDRSHGVRLLGADSGLTNTGSIATSGNQANGLLIDADNITVTNSGTIGTSGDNAPAINLTGFFLNLTNTGTIQATGTNSAAIDTDNDITIINFGTISSSQSAGINMGGANSVLTNSGLVQGTTAVDFTGGTTGAKLTNSGRLVSLNGPTGTAVLFAANQNDTFNLQPGARAVGRLDMNNGTDSVSIDRGWDAGGIWTFENLSADEVSVTGPHFVVTTGLSQGNGVTVVTVDPVGLGASTDSLTGLLGLVNTSLAGQMDRTLAGPAEPPILAPLAYAGDGAYRGSPADQVLDATHDAPGAASDPVGRNVWLTPLAGAFQWDGDTNAHDQNIAGVLGGVDLFAAADGSSLGVTLGTSKDWSEIGSHTDLETVTVLGGIYGQTGIGRAFVQASLLGGWGQVERQRVVANNLVAGGAETVTAGNDLAFGAVNVRARTDIAVSERYQLTPSVQAGYAGLWEDGYQETGTSPMSFGERWSHTVSGRADMRIATPIEGKDGPLAVAWLTAGALGHVSLGDSTATVSILGQSQGIDARSGGDGRFGGLLGLGAERDVGDRFNFRVALEHQAYTDGSQNTVANAGLSIRF